MGGHDKYSKPKNRTPRKQGTQTANQKKQKSRNTNTSTPTHTIYWAPFPFIEKTRTFSQSPNEPLPGN
jgi:hypothetical protein